MQRKNLRSCGLALALGGLAACRAPSRVCAPPRRVVLVTIDTTRADHFGCYGYPRNTTPEIDRLAREGVRFDDFYTPMPTTEPAHASILTGLHPRVHGMRYNGMPVAIPHLPTLGTWFEKRGYATAAIVSRPGLLPQEMGLDGFQWEIRPDPGDELDGNRTYRTFLRWFRRNRKKPFFLWVHFQDPHSPYVPPISLFEKPDGVNQEPLLYNYLPDGACLSPETVERGIARYDGEIRNADDFIGSIARQIDSDRQPGDPPPLMIVTADHGEEMDEVWPSEHLLFSHGRYLYKQELRVPMIVWSPGRVRPAVVRGLYDHTATKGMVERLFAGRTDWKGEPSPYLVAVRRVFELEPPPRPFLAGEDFSILTGDRHVIVYGQRPSEIFFWGERHEIARGKTDEAMRVYRRLAGELTDWKRRTPDARNPHLPVPEERIKILRSLGYLN